MSPPRSLSENRIHYMDNLRGFAMLLGIILHAGLAYGPLTQAGWFIKDSGSTPVLDFMYLFIHIFRIPLFFLISGYFANMLIGKRGVASFFKNRGIRLVLPLLIFLPLLLSSYTHIFHFASGYLSEVTPRLSTFLADVAKGDGSHVYTSHLWFIYYLIFFSGIAALASNITWQAPSRVMKSLLASPKSLLVMPMALVPALAMTSVPTPAPMTFTPEIWVFGFHGVMFFLGWHLYHTPEFLDGLSKKQIAALGAFSLVGFFGLLAMMHPTSPLKSSPIAAAIPTMVTVLESYLTIAMVFFLMGLGKQSLNFHSKAFRYISDASYWLYIVHLPIALIAQTLMVESEMNIFLKFGITSIVSSAVGLVTYALFVRYTVIGTMLNGKRVRPQTPFSLTSEGHPRDHETSDPLETKIAVGYTSHHPST